MNVSYYTGIGSRRTPDDILEIMRRSAGKLSLDDHVLRSGHAPRADQAFESGAGKNAEIYLPWASFESVVQIHREAFVMPAPTYDAIVLASKFHPAWGLCSQGSQKMHARNCHQVLGADLKTPSKFVVCWTPDGSLDGRGPDTEGTGQVLRIAAEFGVKVFNLKRYEHRKMVVDWLMA